MQYDFTLPSGAKLLNASAADALAAGLDQADIDAAINAAIINLADRDIDDFADRLYTTSPSRNARYEAKRAEAVGYKAAGSPANVSANDYPFLVTEAPMRGITKDVLADSIIAAAAAFAAFGAQAEAARAELRTAVPAGGDEQAKQLVAKTILETLIAAAAALNS
jgi:hypothetical protein